MEDWYKDIFIDKTGKYHYDEHTCPTNFFPEVVEIVADKDQDMHGLFEYVKTVEADEINCATDLGKLFKELNGD